MSGLSLMQADSLNVASSFGAPLWGIFGESGQPVLTTNSVLNVEFARDYRISDYPQEKGAFQSYNKVRTPYQAKITFIITDTRVEFLRNVDRAVDSLEFVAVVTPEVSYPSANLTHYDYRRQKENTSLIAVTVWVQEVRIAGQTTLTDSGTTDQFTSPGSSFEGQYSQSTNAANPSSNGSVQPFSASAADAPFSLSPLEPPT